MIDRVNDGISRTLYELSSVLLLPVLLATLLLFGVTLVLVGGLIREALDRGRTRAALRRAIQLAGSAAADADPDGLWAALRGAPSGLPRQFVRSVERLPATAAARAKALADLESDVAVALGRLGFLTRLGPMLGLLGTLIPFGPALAGLSSGDVQALSANLVTAFATTVVGLLCGSVSLAAGWLRRGWYTRDFDDLEHVVETLAEATRHDATVPPPPPQEVGGSGRRPDRRARQPV